MAAYTEQWGTELLVKDLTRLLDYIDEHCAHVSYPDLYRTIVAELSMTLVKRTNLTLLPYLLCIDRYGASPTQCIDMIETIYYRMRRTV